MSSSFEPLPCPETTTYDMPLYSRVVQCVTFGALWSMNAWTAVMNAASLSGLSEATYTATGRRCQLSSRNFCGSLDFAASAQSASSSTKIDTDRPTQPNGSTFSCGATCLAKLVNCLTDADSRLRATVRA